MRTAPRRLSVLLCLLLLTGPLAHAAPPSDGSTMSVSSDETWTEDASLNGHVTVESGSSLTVSANITMETGSSITVEEGGQLVVTNGALLSNDLNAGLMVNSMFARLSLEFGDLAEDGVVQLKFDHTIPLDVKMNVTLGDTTVNASGLDMVRFDAPLNGTVLDVSFDSYYFTPTYVLWAKAIHSGGVTATLMAQDINASDAPLYWFQSAFDIVAHGDLTVTSSNVEGANITCHALCRFDNAALTGSAPVDAAATSTVTVLNSVIDGSRSDEDIIVHDQAPITYTNSVGTGGTTDAWIRLLPSRTLETNIPNGSLDISGIGWGSSNWNDLTDENGNIVLVGPGATNEHKRIVEWMDGNGVVHQEEATITLSISSSWGTYSTTVDAPTTSIATMHLDLPFIAVTELKAEANTATVNESIGLMATVTNTGNASLTGLVNVWCYVGEDIAETTQVSVSLAAGETKEVPLSWYAYDSGESALTCKPLLPANLNDISSMVVNLDGATSDTITWEYAEEVEETPIIIWLMALLGFAGLALFVASQSRKQQKTYVDHEVMEMPEEEPGEGVEDAEANDGGSIYDLSPEDEA
jgi:hypothetical protein